MNVTEIGWTGRAHGLRGEIKLRVQEFYEEDLLASTSVLIGEPPVPYFLEKIRAGGAIIAKLEGLDSREQVSLLANKPLWLLTSQVATEKPQEDTPYDALIGFTITTENYPELGPIREIIDLPEHYLAELEHEGKSVLVPLHENLIAELQEEEKRVEMVLPDGLLELGE